MKLYLDPGHGGSDPGASGNGLKEKNIVLDIALNIRTILMSDYENINVKMSRTTDISKTLQQRTNEANSWGANYYLSIHCNSFNGSAEGYEDYIHNSLSDSSQTAKYQDIMHEAIMKVNGLNNRGKKKANFHVLRETSMPALLTENGFIDNAHDASFMKDAKWRKLVAQGHVNGLAKAFNLKRKENNSGSNSNYRVIAGSFQEKANAEDRVDFLRARGIESFVDTITISGVLWYRVQAGAFTSRDNAEKRVKEIKDLGVGAFITEG